MTTLSVAVDADDKLWTVDTLPDSPFLEAGDELVEVSALFPEHVYKPTMTTIPAKVRVTRAVAGTTAATHAQGITLTQVYPESAADAGGGAIAVTDGTTTVASVTELQVPSVASGGAGVAVAGPITGSPGLVYFQPNQPGGSIEDGSIWFAANDDESTYTMQVYSSGAGGWTDPQPATDLEGPEDSGTSVRMVAANNAGAGDGGSAVITAGDASGAGAAGGNVTITAGDPGAGGTGGGITLTAGAGGTISLTSQVALPEVIQVSSIPFADPGVFGQLWCDFADGFRVKVSEGP